MHKRRRAMWLDSWYMGITEWDIGVLNRIIRDRSKQPEFSGRGEFIKYIRFMIRNNIILEGLSISYEDIPLYINSDLVSDTVNRRYIMWRLEIGK